MVKCRWLFARTLYRCPLISPEWRTAKAWRSPIAGPVALLIPIRGNEWDDLLARGRVVVPTEDGDIADQPPDDYGIDATSALTALREDER